MKRIVLYLLIGLVISGLLAACGGSDPPPPEPVAPQPSEAAASPPPAKDPNLLRVGVSTDTPPFVYEEAGAIVGFDIDLMNALAQKTGHKVEYIKTFDWAGIFNDLAAGEFDAVISAATITPERQEIVAFTDSYFETGLAIAVQANSGIQGSAGLNGRKVGVQQGTTGEIWVEKNSSATLQPVRDINLALEALGRGEVDAVVHDRLIMADILSGQEAQIKLLPDLLTTESYGIAVSRDRPDLLFALNQALLQLQQGGEYAQLCQKWFQTADVCLTPGGRTAPPTPTQAAAQAPTPTQAESTTAEQPAPTETTPPPTPKPISCEVAPITSQAAGQPYQIQAGDWLSKIANREYGNPLNYRAIVQYTNQQCRIDNTFSCIENPDRVQPDWTIYLPTAAEIEAYWSGQISLPPINWQASGPIQVAGSSTVYPLTQQLATCFQAGGFADDINIQSTGTFGGFERFCNGEVDIVNASYPMTEADRAMCRNNGRQPVEFHIGTDALTIVVSGRNAFVHEVSGQELRQILSAAASWPEVRADWPDAPVNRYYPTTDSGTFESVVDILFGGDEAALNNAPNIQMQSEDDEVLVRAIQNDPVGVGFFGYAYYDNHQDILRALPVDGVEPRPETVDQKSYPLIRPLFIYSAPQVMKEKPQVAAFINFYLAHVKDYITEVGYFLPPEAALQEAMQTYNQAIQ